jgi:hypothetical protein
MKSKPDGITWAQRVENLRKELGRELTLPDLLRLAPQHKMTSEERQAQAESWARANVSTGDPRFD